MKLLILCHVLIAIGIVNVRAQTGPNFNDPATLGPKTPEDRAQAQRALYQGEQGIIGAGLGTRNAIALVQRKWPGGAVPYVIHGSLDNSVAQIQAAMLLITGMTQFCITFVPRSNQENYLRIFAGDGCYSYIGMVGGAQDLSLGPGCLYTGTIIHELTHALGFFHEHNRSDRDPYVTIVWENIQPGMETQFGRLLPSQNLLLSKFDYDSIMIYGNTAFSEEGLPTIVATNGKELFNPYDKMGLTSSDAKRIVDLYCPAG